VEIPISIKSEGGDDAVLSDPMQTRSSVVCKGSAPRLVATTVISGPNYWSDSTFS